MKKTGWIMICFLILFLPIESQAVATSSFEKELYIYLLTEEDCEICKEEQKWLEEKYQDNLHVYVKILDKKEQNNLYQKTKELLSISKDTLPITVIGSNYFYDFSDSTRKTIEEAANAYLENNQYCNVIQKIQNQEDVTKCLEKNKGIYQKSNSFSPIKVGIFITIGIFFLGGIGIYFYKRKK